MSHDVLNELIHAFFHFLVIFSLLDIFLDFLEDAEAEKNSQLAEAIAQLNSYDLILFLEPDVEWVQDGDRSEVIAADREKYSAKIKELYKKHGFTFKVISGDYNSRFDRAVKLIKDILQS